MRFDGVGRHRWSGDLSINMPHWKPQEMGRIIKRTKHKAWCVLCGEHLQKGDMVIRQSRHGIRLLCRDCGKAVKMAMKLLKIYKEKIQ